MILPVLQDDNFLDDVRRADTQDGQFRLWWLGQSGFLVQYQGRHLLLDPYLSDSLTKKYASTDKPHIRMTGRVIDPARLDFIDVVTSSHAHTDHLDPETLRPLVGANPGLRIVAPEANRPIVAERSGMEPVVLLDGASVEYAGFRVTAVPAAHEEVAPEYTGFVVQFGPWSVYHAGDTLLYPDMVDRLRPFAVTVALLPINGRAPERRVAGNLNGREAAWLAHAIGARLAIPMHYEMFTFNTESPEAFAAAAKELCQPCRVLRCGERWSSLHSLDEP
jgi:L-ascorbate metabolism protein UlaG (beta-lactamase superfamily)